MRPDAVELGDQLRDELAKRPTLAELEPLLQLLAGRIGELEQRVAELEAGKPRREKS